MRLLRWILCRLEHPHAARWVIAIGLLLSLPALAAPLGGGLLSWVSNRHALVAGVLAVWTLVAHDRARRDRWRAGPWLAPLLFGLGLLASEMALATGAYLVAHALVIDREGSARLRLARLWPFALVALGWQIVYSSLGYGVVGSGSYLHPLHEPLAYLVALPQRAVVLALGQLSPIASDFWLFYPPAARVVVAAIAVAVVVAVTRVSSAATRAAPAARAMVIGALLSLLPIAAAAPGDRNLVFVGLGASAWLGVVLEALARASEPSARLERVVVRGLVVTSFVLGPLFLPLKCLANLNLDAMRAAADAAVPREPGVELERVVVASVPSEGPIFFAWRERDAARIPRPRHTLLLSSSLGAVSIERLAADTLRVSPERGFFASDAQTLLRSASRPFHQGEIVQLSDVRVTVVELTDDGRPRVVDFRFTTSLDPTRGLWLRGDGMGLVRWRPPAVGETVVVPAAM